LKKFLVGAAALAATFTGVMSVASPAQAYGYGPGGHWGGYGYHGGWGYRGGGYGWAPAVAAGVVAGAALAYPYAYGPPPAYYAGPSYYGYYHGCRRSWVWTGWNYRLVTACR